MGAESITTIEEAIEHILARAANAEGRDCRYIAEKCLDRALAWEAMAKENREWAAREIRIFGLLRVRA
jgi:hypothetical protein